MRTYRNSPSLRLARVLRDLPGKDVPQPVQTIYLNEVSGLFLRSFVKVYGKEELSEKDKADMRRYLEKAIEAKEANDGKFKETGRQAI